MLELFIVIWESNLLFFYGTLSFEPPAGRPLVFILLALKIIYNKHVKCMLRFRAVVSQHPQDFIILFISARFAKSVIKKRPTFKRP